ncbi:MAG TPA: DUF480 domain-containing protein [Acidimicrobiales bacterium]|nr:DUF480 domain-containing protein [Acidimicrobiales bacterium]
MELTAAEGRVLGCLIEQEALAPDAVPLTLNTLRLACNQTSGRDPVVAYDDRTVEDTLLSLKSRGLARFVPPSGDVRTPRYRHRADERWRMGPVELAVLAVLLLRGVQTVGEVRAQVQRLHPLADPAEVDAVLDALAARTPRPFAARLRRRPGDHETRWAQVLTGPAPAPPDDEGPPTGGEARPRQAAPDRLPVQVTSPSYAELVARVADLERRLAAALERAQRPERTGGDWRAPAFPPPPPPPVEVGPGTAARLGAGDDERRHQADHRASRSGGAAPDVGDLAARLGDVERRLARIEAELGALR